MNLSSSSSLRPQLKTGNPEKLGGDNARSWLKSLDNIFRNQNTEPDDRAKIKYAVGYMTGAGLQWWESVTLNGTTITSYRDLQRELLNYFEPVNCDLTARRMPRNLKQMGKLTLVREYNKEFSKWLLQIPTMTPAEQISHYSQGLKSRTRIEVERAEPITLQDAMKIADRLDSLYTSGQNFSGLPDLHPDIQENQHQCKLVTYSSTRRGIVSLTRKMRRVEK